MRHATWKAVGMERRAIRFAGLAGIALVAASPAAAADRFWKVPNSGYFGTGTNWTGNLVPGVADHAKFGQTGSGVPFTVQLLTQTFTVGNLSITNQIPQFVLADGEACCATLNVNGTLAVRTGTSAQPVSFLQGTTQAGTFVVGTDSVGAARLEGATLSCTEFSVGSGNTGSVGSLEVMAGSTLLKNNCCDAGIGRGTGTVGTMTVDSSDVFFGWKLFVGRGGGTGTLELGNGSLLDLTASQDLYVGFAENAVTQGTLNILSGSTVSARSLYLGDGSLASGDMTIDGGTLSLTTRLHAGAWESDAEVSVKNGGQILADDVAIGVNGGTATMVIEGPGAFMRGLAAIGADSNLQPTGVLQVLDGAHVSSLRYDGTKRFCFLGIGPGASGTAIVSGAGSLWSGIDWLTVGGVYHTDTNASGTVKILDGGRVECLRAIIAERPSDDGSVTVDGPGSIWAINGQLVVGNAAPDDGGDGDLIVRDGGQVTCNVMGIGSSGSLSVELSSASNAAAIAVNGHAALAGALSVTLKRGFTPAPGVPIPLISATSLGGGFGSISLPSNAILEQTGGQLRVLFSEDYVDLDITPSKLQALVGYATQASATAVGKSGSTLNVSSLATWSSSNPAVVSVDADGTLFGWATGRAIISASYEDLVAQADVIVGQPASPSAFELLSATASGVQSNEAVPGGFPDLSDDSELCLLWTSSEVLTGPTPGPIDLIVKDRMNGSIDLVNRNTAGSILVIPAVAYATMSGDGRYVVFTSGDPAAIPGAPASDQVYLRDRLEGTLELVSIADNESMPNGSSNPGWISSDGRYVAFRSTATNLVSGISGIGGTQVYLRDRVAGTTTIVSAANGVASNATTDLAVAITPGGEYVTFQTRGSNLVPNDTNSVSDVFRFTTATGSIERVSLTASGNQAQGGESFAADISDDGQRVLFLSEATNLIPGQNGLAHVYVRDLSAGTTVLVSKTESGGFSAGACGSIAISGDGRYASFRTSGPLVAEDANASDDIYRYGIDDDSLLLVTASTVSGSAVGDGRYTAISDDGGVVLFQSTSSELAPFDLNGVMDWFLWGDARPVTGDLNGDRTVTASDLAILLGAWGTSNPDADLNGDGIVDGMDLAILLGGWTG